MSGILNPWQEVKMSNSFVARAIFSENFNGINGFLNFWSVFVTKQLKILPWLDLLTAYITYLETLVETPSPNLQKNIEDHVADTQQVFFLHFHYYSVLFRKESDAFASDNNLQ